MKDLLPASLAIDSLPGDARAAFEVAAANRYRGIAFSTGHPELNPEALGASARRHLKTILATKHLALDTLRAPAARDVSANAGGLTHTATIDRTLDNARQAMALARELGVHTVAINIGRLVDPALAGPHSVPDATLVAALRDLAQHADAIGGLTLAVGADGPSDRLAALIKAVDFDRARIDFETARLIAAGEDPAAVAEKLAGSLGNVTLADALRSGKTVRAAPLGEGQLPLADLLELLRQQDFRGPTIIDPRNLQNPESAAGRAAEALRRALARA